MSLWAKFFGRSEPVDLAQPPVSSANLRTQIFRNDYFGMKLLAPGRPATRQIAPGLVEAIVEELGGAQRTVNWEALAQFDTDRDRLFALGRQQSVAHERNIQSMTVGELVQVFANNGFYLSSVMLETFARAHHKHGVLFVPVSSHHWCVHIVQALSVPPVVAMLRVIADSLAEKMSCSDSETLTRDVLWYKPNGVIEKLEGDELPPELAVAMASAFRESRR
jgi:hypothetical protein